MYQQDSLFTLSYVDIAMVLTLSALLALFTLWLALRLMKDRAVWKRVLIGLTAFYLYVWLSPQVFYTLYIIILEGLRWQVVVWDLPTPAFLGRLLTFSDRANLSSHGQGFLGWLLILLSLFKTWLPYPFSER